MGVERQAYHSNSLIGNDCHLLLKSENITKLCYSILDIVRELEKGELLIEVGKSCEQFENLFNKYGCCHIVFNSARHLNDDEIDLLSDDIKPFMDYLRCNWPGQRITPKLHILEDHVVDFVRKWKVGIGFYGEQGGESIHKEVNKLRRTYSTVQRDTDRLQCIMKQQLLSCHPKPKTIQPKKVKRNLKRKNSDTDNI